MMKPKKIKQRSLRLCGMDGVIQAEAYSRGVTVTDIICEAVEENIKRVPIIRPVPAKRPTAKRPSPTSIMFGELDKEINDRAKQTGVSFNRIVVDAIKKKYGVQKH